GDRAIAQRRRLFDKLIGMTRAGEKGEVAGDVEFGVLGLRNGEVHPDWRGDCSTRMRPWMRPCFWIRQFRHDASPPSCPLAMNEPASAFELPVYPQPAAIVELNAEI